MTYLMNGVANATFYYDGDGNRVNATVAGVTTVYVRNYLEWTSLPSTMKKFYFAGDTCVAMQTGTTLR